MAGSIVTEVGLTKLSSASPLDQLKITTLAVGDGNGGFPDLNSGMTELTNQVWSGVVSNPIRDPENENILIFEAYILSEDGGFTIREQAIFDEDGDMIAIGHTAEIEKPEPSSSIGVTVTMRMHIALSNDEQVELFYTDTPQTHHNSLTNRDDEDSHPASAISTDDNSNVQEKLNYISQHSNLNGLDDEDSHPASAISADSGLTVQEELDQINETLSDGSIGTSNETEILIWSGI
jgi:hypothetical protein